MANGDLVEAEAVVALREALEAVEHAIRVLSAQGAGGFVVGLASNARCDLREAFRLLVSGGGEL